MAVQNIEQYGDILKVILKPTQKFPNGYFYCDADAIDLVEKHCWSLHQGNHNNVYVDTTFREFSDDIPATLRFHKELAKSLGLDTTFYDIDHISSVALDNTDENLNIVRRQQNTYNRFNKGYKLNLRLHAFLPRICINYEDITPYGAKIKSEDKACILQNELEQVWLREQLGDQYYMFDFKKYRRGSEDILDLERTGKISEEEATYRHVMRYADNAWYYLRYNLEQYFKDNHIQVPTYDLDEQGFMIDKITRKRLCPFN